MNRRFYSNPILLCDYSDPDVVQYKDKFYMTASSFNYVPGLPILESNDLVNWNLVNYALKEIPFKKYDFPQHGKGIWAPSIRFHNGKFVITVAMPDEGIFVTESDNPCGAWTPLRCVWEGKGFIDPCPIWDDDGNAWIVHAYANSRCGIKSMLGILEADAETLDCRFQSPCTPGKNGDRFIFDGHETQPTIEGPKVYRRNGFYYIFAPAGGVETGWQTVLRSKCIQGPFEEKIVLSSGNSLVNGPHQGGYVETSENHGWFVHFQSRGVYGRIVHLQPVTWIDDWPFMGTGADTCKIPGEPVLTYKKELLPEVEQKSYKDTYLDWQWPANYKANYFYGKTKVELKKFPEGKSLSVLPGKDDSLWSCPNICTKKVSKLSFEVKLVLDVASLSENARSGLLLLGDQYAAIEVFKTQNAIRFRYVESKYDDEKGDERRIETIISESEPIVSEDSIVSFEFKFKNIDSKSASCVFSAEARINDSEAFAWRPPVKPFFPSNGHWVGCRTGFYAAGKNPGYVTVLKYLEKDVSMDKE